MKVIALLSFYDEHPGWLAGCVASCAPVVDHVIAVDGAYSLYPGGRPKSCTDQGEAIREACRALKMGCTLYEPQAVWKYNEVEKRTFMFRLAETVAEANTDWYFVIDADELVTDWGGADVKAILSDTYKDVAQATLWNRRPQLLLEQPSEDAPPFANPSHQEEHLRMFFRAIPGLHVSGMHFHYKLPDGTFLWADGAVEIREPEDLTMVRVEHRTAYRDPTRRQDAQTYYNRRVEYKIEERLG